MDGKLRSIAFYIWQDTSLWAHRILSFHMHLSYLGPILFPVPPFSRIPPDPQQSPWELAASDGLKILEAFIHIWRP